ncbi:MAG: hypothetical protein FD170_3061 [Bacteroidetes bacterium]|nr:MAG: hypothetical protein FD170_3061 [Bacteroidota bacterium]
MMNLKKSVIAAIFLKTEKNNQSPINLINVKNTSTPLSVTWELR